MDILATLMGFGIGGAIVGAFLMLVWRGMFMPTLGTTGKNVALVAGIVLIVTGLAGAGYIQLGVADVVEEDVGVVFWDASATEGQAHLVPIAGIDGFEARISYNQTSDLFHDNTQWIVVNWTISRGDQIAVDAKTECAVTSVGQFTAITGSDAGDTKEAINLNANGDYAVTWSKNSGDYTDFLTDTDLDTPFPRSDTHDDGWCAVNITLNPAMFDLMSQVGDSTSITVDIAGNPWSFLIRLNEIPAA